jgi:alanine dehydrogenase
MLYLSAPEVAARLDRATLIDALDAAFAAGCVAPQRASHAVGETTEPGKHLLVMPAWRAGEAIGVKLVTVFAENGGRGLPAVHASYSLFCGRTGVPLAVLDGTELTLRRTAATSALAARYLADPAASRLLMVGTGNLAPHVIASHALVRPIREVRVWGRRHSQAEAVARRLAGEPYSVTAARDLEAAVRWADVVSCATLATTPLVLGSWLRPGQHLDLIGSFTPAMREADDEAVHRADVYVDTRAGALAESGELLSALASGSLRREDIRAELAELAAGRVRPLRRPTTITLFKSVGAAIEDLAAAQLAIRSAPA